MYDGLNKNTHTPDLKFCALPGMILKAYFI